VTTWQPLPGRGDERPDPRPVSESLDRVAVRLGAPGASVLRAVFAGWEDVVGSVVAAHTRPLLLRDRVLVVATEQPAWASQLRFLGPELVRRLAAVAGDGAVDRVEVRVVAPGGR
jgi:predicted nucleic acid-binding Zn ribbon protein